jgi:hypothetical protein
MNLFSSQDPFADRSQLIKSDIYQEHLIDQIKEIDVTKIKEDGDFEVRTKIVEGQKVYFWIRVYLKEEDNSLSPNDDISIRYAITGEILNVKFICYNKSILTQDHDPNVVNYNPEDDRKVLCLMVDSERINKDSEDIPFIRTLFKIGRHYEYQLLKREDLEIVIEKNGQILDYFDIDF